MPNIPILANRLGAVFATLLFGSLPVAAHAASAGKSLISLLENPSMETNYILLGMAVVQVIVILALSGIIKTLGGSGSVWADYLKRRGPGVILLPLFLLQATDGMAASSAPTMMSSQSLFWWLIATNVVFFIIIIAQMTLLKGMVRSLSGKVEEPVPVEQRGPSFVDEILSRMTRQVEVEKEEDILMHHEYDGIRELDNVLPPWWLWLFYGTILWGVVYLVNVHVIRVWPDQDTAYIQEMEQARADIDRYLATKAEAVDENTVVVLSDESSLSAGNAIFQEFCKACHGSAGEGNAVGPNLTDAYWLHGGDIKDLFRTIKYGVVEKGMQSWKSDLSPKQMQDVASYILSLQGSGPPNAKEPQGELYVPRSEPAKSGGEDTVGMVQDTVTTAS